MTKVLFLSEAVTWSQVTRLMVLARGLEANQSRFQAHFAASHFDPQLFDGTKFERSHVHSLSAAEVDARLARGGRIYDAATLARYVDDERRLFDRVKPDIIVSDLRWSTCISAPLAKIPLATLIDAYWFRPLSEYPIPDHPLVRLLGVEHVKKGFGVGLAFMLRHFAKPVNDLRKKHGLAPLGDLRDVLAFGNTLLFPDDPALAPSDRPGFYLGPVIWSPQIPFDEIMESKRGAGRPLVYVTLGSSGSIGVVEKILEALDPLHVDVLLSTAGRFELRRRWPRVHVVGLAPGDLAARKASVVICNGGASTAYQALAEGTPIVGIPSNLDAALSMSCIAASGAGVGLRSSDDVQHMRSAVQRVLMSPEIHRRAQEIAASFRRYDPQRRFVMALEKLSNRVDPSSSSSVAQGYETS
jgi:UDP:flavonoid glycosyltransferase YjiC (YdhE family)